MDFYFQHAIANSTQRTYASAQSRYLSFCSQFFLQPIPVNESLLCRFVSFLAMQNISHSSIKGYLSAIRRLQIAQGLPDPLISQMAKLEGVVRGIKSQQAHSAPSPVKRLPITLSILRQLKQHIVTSTTDLNRVMIWAAACVCFFGFLRAGELTVPSESTFDRTVHLCFSDVSVDCIHNPQVVKLRLKASKTDPFRKGVDVVLGRTHNDMCPVTALLAYLALRGNTQGCLFHFADGRLLTKQRFIQRIREALLACGFNPTQFAGHSFRIGAATTAAGCGMNDSTIKMLGRWESAAFQVYIRTPRDKLASLSAVLGK